jgi:uncharacterized membrane protein YccC
VRRGFGWLDWGRFHWRDAAVGPGVRAALGVLTPLAIGTAVGRVEYGTYAALGALPAGFVTFSGVTRTRVLNVSAAAVGMAISAFIGSVTAGGMPWVMVSVVLIWGYATGLVAALGPTAISIAQQCAVALLVANAVPLGVEPAAIRAALVLAGGLWQGALVASSWTLSRGAAERTALATSYDALSQYAAQPAGSYNGQLLLEDMPATEALADPNPLLRSAERLRLVSLGEEAERIRVSLSAIKAVADEESAAARSSLLQESAYALADIADALSARGPRRQREQLRSLALSGKRIAAITPPRDAGWRWAAEGLLGQVRSATRISELLLGAKPPGPPLRPPRRQQRPAKPAAEVRRQPTGLRYELLAFRACLGPSSEAGAAPRHKLLALRACLGPSSEAGRHAVRLGVTAALTALLVRVAGLSHGYWAVLTVFIVLRPDYSSTLQRGVQRAGGTVIGAGLGVATALLAKVGTPALLVGTGVSLAAAYSVFMVNFLLLGVFLTDFVVVFLALLGLPADQTALARLAGTGVGAALALIGYVVWPTWAGSSANEKFAVLLEGQGQYAAGLLRAYSRPAADDAALLRSLQLEGRRAHSDADASAERLIDEPPKPPMTAELARALIAEAERLATAELILQAAVSADGEAGAVPSPQAGPGQARLDRLAAGLGTASDVLARSLRALRPPGPLPPLRQLQAAVSRQPGADRILLTTTDAIVDAVNSTTDILRRYLNGSDKQGSART